MSALYSVGSPHTWPALLTALTWLVQIFVYEEEANAMIDRCRNFGKFERSQVLHRATPP